VPDTAPVHWEKLRIWDRWQEESRPKVGAAYQAQREKVVNYITGLDKPVTVLELCCGTGRLAFDLLNCQNVIRLQAIDLSPRAIATLNDRLREHPRAAILEAEVANVLQFGSWSPRAPIDVIICIDALPNLSWSMLPELFQRIASVLKPGGCFIGNYLSSENIDAHTARKHGRLGYLRIYGRLMLGQALSFLNPAWVGEKGLIRTGTVYRKELVNLLEQYFEIDRLHTDSYHWFAAVRKE